MRQGKNSASGNSSPPRIGSRRLRRTGGTEAQRWPIIATAGTVYLFFSVAFAIYTFPNFSLLDIAKVALLFGAPPLILLWSARPDSRATDNSRPLIAVLTSSGVAVSLVIVQLAGFEAWSSYFSVSPFRRLEIGGGFNEDSAFHVSIIHSILAGGMPSIRQHLEGDLRYHVLSHYADAIIIMATGLDPWESYGLLFFFKGVLVCLLMLWWLGTNFRHMRLGFIVPSAFALVLGVTSSWIVIGSHGQWFPFVILLLSSPWIFKKMSGPSIDSRTLASLTAIVFVLSLGKVSMGFGLAIFIGFWLLLREPKKLRTYIVGVVWVLFFFFWGSSFDRNPKTVPLHHLFYNLSAEFTSIVFFALMLLALAKISGTPAARHAALSALIGLVLISALAVALLPHGTDAYYFAIGLSVAVTLISIPFIIDYWGRRSVKENGGNRQNRGTSQIALFTVIFFVLSPLIAKAPITIFNSFQENAKVLAGALNLAGGSGVARESEPGEVTYFERFRDELHETVDASGVSRSQTVLFISKEEYESLESTYNLEKKVFTGLLVTATTGLTLVRSVHSDDFVYPGFKSYDQESYRISKEDFSTEELCKFNRPVVMIVDLLEPSFTMSCD